MFRTTKQCVSTSKILLNLKLCERVLGGGIVRKARRPGGRKVSCDHSILVVEDDLVLAKQYLETFERLGVGQLHLATDLVAAHQICDRNRLSGVLMDFCLGGSDTLQLESVLRRRKIPFIVISGYSSEDIFVGL